MRALVGVAEGVGNIIHMSQTIEGLRQLGYEVDVFATSTMKNGYDCLRDSERVQNFYTNATRIDVSVYDVGVLGIQRRGLGIVSKCKRVVVPRIDDFTKFHEAEVNFDSARQLGFEREMPNSWVAKSDRDFELDKASIIVHTAKHWNGLWKKKWFARWEELIEKLSTRFEVVLVGTSVDRVSLKTRVVDYVDKLDLQDLASLIFQAKACITSDSGISHLSAATGQRTIVLWGPTNLVKNSPKGVNVKIIRHIVKCPDGGQSPCQTDIASVLKGRYHNCRNNVCMNHDVRKIVESIDGYC